MVHIYTGDGKGKTTAACGLCVRSAGCGKKVLFVQFLKNGTSSEINALSALGIDVMTDYPSDKFLWEMSDTELDRVRSDCNTLFSKVCGLSGGYDVIVLDEIIGALCENMLCCEQVLTYIMENKDREIILTGRNAPERLCDAADYVSEIKSIKHPMENGTPPRIGIEY